MQVCILRYKWDHDFKAKLSYLQVVWLYSLTNCKTNEPDQKLNLKQEDTVIWIAFFIHSVCNAHL